MKNMSTVRLKASIVALVILVLLGIQALATPGVLVSEEAIAAPPDVKMRPAAAAKLEVLHRDNADRHRQVEADAKSHRANSSPQVSPRDKTISAKMAVAVAPEEAMRKAKGTNARAKVGSIKLENRAGTAVYVVSINGKDVVVDATTGDMVTN